MQFTLKLDILVYNVDVNIVLNVVVVVVLVLSTSLPSFLIAIDALWLH